MIDRALLLARHIPTLLSAFTFNMVLARSGQLVFAALALFAPAQTPAALAAARL